MPSTLFPDLTTGISKSGYQTNGLPTDRFPSTLIHDLSSEKTTDNIISTSKDQKTKNSDVTTSPLNLGLSTEFKNRDFSLTSKKHQDFVTVGEVSFHSPPASVSIENGGKKFVTPMVVVSALIFLIGVLSFVGIRFRKKRNRVRRGRNRIVREEAMMEMTSVINDRYGIQELGSERCLFIPYLYIFFSLTNISPHMHV